MTVILSVMVFGLAMQSPVAAEVDGPAQLSLAIQFSQQENGLGMGEPEECLGLGVCAPLCPYDSDHYGRRPVEVQTGSHPKIGVGPPAGADEQGPFFGPYEGFDSGGCE